MSLQSALISVFSLSLLVSSANAADPPAKKTNVLFCIADDASPHFGCYGCTWAKTPNIDRLGKAGLIFDNTYTPTAKCAPSRSAILTGRNPWQLEDAANHQSFFPAKFKAFTEVLAEAGVHVGAQGKTWGPGTAKTTDGKPRNFGLTTYGGGADPGVGFRKFLAARDKQQPFFFWFGSHDPHRAYKPDSGIAAGKKPSDIEHVPAMWPDNDTVRRDMLDYAIEVEAYDAQVGSLVKALEEAGELDNTLVIVTSDHGMPFPRVKGHNYDMANRIPMVVHWPAGIVHTDRHVPEFVSLIDVAPTVLDVMGIKLETVGMSPITGRTFGDLLRDKPAANRETVILGRERNDVLARPGTPHGLGYPVRGIREGNLLYLHNFAADRWPCGNPDMGLKDTDASPTKKLIEDLGEKNQYWELCYGKRPEQELFDLSTDPDCVKNLADLPEYQSRKKELREKMFAELKRQNDPRILGQGDVFDNYTSVKNIAAGSDAPAKKGKQNAKQKQKE